MIHAYSDNYNERADWKANPPNIPEFLTALQNKSHKNVTGQVHDTHRNHPVVMD
jgi:hypothetical protein